MLDENLARLRTHRNNISRIAAPQDTPTDYEREFIERRLAEELSAFHALAAVTFPATFDMPIQPPEPPTTHEAA